MFQRCEQVLGFFFIGRVYLFRAIKFTTHSPQCATYEQYIFHWKSWFTNSHVEIATPTPTSYGQHLSLIDDYTHYTFTDNVIIMLNHFVNHVGLFAWYKCSFSASRGIMTVVEQRFVAVQWMRHRRYIPALISNHYTEIWGMEFLISIRKLQLLHDFTLGMAK